MYVGEDVSPDFYAWVFPKCDHVAVGTGTVVDKKGIQRRGGQDEKGMNKLFFMLTQCVSIGFPWCSTVVAWQRYQQGIRDRAAPRIDGGEIIRVEAHPIPEHPRPWRVKDPG